MAVSVILERELPPSLFEISTSDTMNADSQCDQHDSILLCLQAIDSHISVGQSVPGSEVTSLDGFSAGLAKSSDLS